MPRSRPPEEPRLSQSGPQASSRSRLTPSWLDHLAALGWRVLVTVALGVVILWLLVNPRTLAARALRSRPMHALGALSFGLYVWHPLALPAGERLASWLPATTQAQVDLRTGSHLFLYVVLVGGMAAASYALVERPFLRLKDRRAGRRSGPAR